MRTHTDLVTAQNAVERAQYQLRLARITSICPNIDTNPVIEHDFTTPPFVTVVSLQVGVPLPIVDNNRGNSIAAEAALVRARCEYERARNDLFTNLADTFARYETNRQTAQQYHNSILVNQVRAYRGAYQRYQVDPDADFNDVVTSQQTLASTISTYIQLLGDQWQAVADLAGLMQDDDIFALGQTRVRVCATSQQWRRSLKICLGVASTRAYSETSRQRTEFSDAVLASIGAPVGGILVPDSASIHPGLIGGDSASRE